MDKAGPISLQTLRRRVVEVLKARGIDAADIEARELICFRFDCDAHELIVKSAELVDEVSQAQVEALVARRLSGEPLDHIMGFREFYGRRFQISKHILSPRADTEIVVETGLKRIADIGEPRILDLGVGSGAILITLLAEHIRATGIGVDLSQAALDMAQKNAQGLEVSDRSHFMKSDWFSKLSRDQKFDLIISNPPYISDEEMEGLSTEVSQFDPDLALRGGMDGLAAYRVIISEAPEYMKPGGWVVLEIGYQQARPVSDMMTFAGFSQVEVLKDLGGNDRVVCGRI